MSDPDSIRRLEEAQAFTDRTVEELSDEVRDLGRRAAQLAAMLNRLELRLRRIETGDQPMTDTDRADDSGTTGDLDEQ